MLASASANVNVTNTNPLTIGAYASGTCDFNGLISNVQIYKTALNVTQAKSSYALGIGGSPVTSGNLAAWWPLNGNANDYSGNGNNGVGTSVTYG